MPQPPFAIVLGTAQDGGYPHIGCGCDLCMRAVTDPSHARRVACLGLVTSKGVAIIDATPDLPSQWRELASAGRQRVDEPPRAILLTHLHAGHILGLPLLGREGWAGTRTPLWTTEASLASLERNEPFARLLHDGHVIARVLHLGWDTSLDDIVIQPIPVPHRAEEGDVVAYRIEGPEHSLLYAPDVDILSPDVLEQIRSADVALLDGTFFRNRELSRDDTKAVPHPAIADTMSAVAELGTRILFTHLNHTNPALNPTSRERMAVEALGMRIAAEGDTIPLG